MMQKQFDLTGQKFGRLLIVRFTSVQKKRKHWLCVCDCRSVTGILEVPTAKLRNGHTRSCGCLQREAISRIGKITGRTNGQARRIHGHSNAGGGKRETPTYRSWTSMMARCTNSKKQNFAWYGGRGVSVCDRWKIFENFLEDMGIRPDGKTLDRYPDKNGDYEPANCRWATMKEQCQNRRKRRDARY